LLIARVRTVRQARTVLAQPWIAFLQAFAVVFGGVVAVGRVPVAGYAAVWPYPGAYEFGLQVATAGTEAGLESAGPEVLATTRGFAGTLVVLLVFLTGLKEATDGAMNAHTDALLLATGPRTVAIGELCWSVAFAGWQFGGLVVAGAVAFGVGSGSALAAVTLLLAGVALLVTAVPVGYVLALVTVVAFRRTAVLREHRLLVGAPLAVAYFALFVRARESIAALSTLPVGWFADLGLVSVGAGADPVRGLLALSVAPATVAVSAVLAASLGESVWYGDPPRERTVDAGSDRSRRFLTTVASRPVAAVVRTVWTRARREPRVLVFAALPVAVTASAGVELVSLRPAALPAVVAVYGSAAVGMGVTLNPLGNAGRGLTAALTTPDGGRHLVRGYALSAALPGVALVVIASSLAAVAVGVAPAGLTVVVVAAVALTVGGAITSIAVGLALPNHDGLRATGAGGAVRPPRLWATTVFLFVQAALGLPAIVGLGWGQTVAAAADGVSPTAVSLVGVSLTVVAATVVAGAAYRYAVSRVDGYTVE
jgi:hypothetical protein